MTRIAGRITSCATLAVLLVAYASPGSAQDNKMSDVADQLRTALAGEPVTVTQQGPVTLTLTSSADAMFPSGGWQLKPGAPVLSKIVPTLSKLQHTEIVVGGYTDNDAVSPTLQSAGISNNLDLSCKRAASVVVYLVSQGVNPNLLSAQCFGDTHPVGPNDTPEGQAKNRRVNITLTGEEVWATGSPITARTAPITSVRSTRSMPAMSSSSRSPGCTSRAARRAACSRCRSWPTARSTTPARTAAYSRSMARPAR